MKQTNWPALQYDDLPCPCGRAAETSNEELRAFLGKVKAASTHADDPMQKFDHTTGRAAALELYAAHLDKYVDGPALKAARAAFLAMHSV
jgi:hypothetical protein